MTRAADSGPVAGVVLAGGQSRRMGTDKADIVFVGARLIDIARDALKRVGCSAVFVSGRSGESDGIPDRAAGNGPAHAMLDCLDFIGDDYRGALFLPVDMPLLEAINLTPLIRKTDGLCRAWAEHPLPVFIPSGLARPAHTQVRSVKSLLATLPVVWMRIPEGQRGRFANLNTQADLTNACKLR
jgi:molybdenum cofactor guanylyltransferase